MKPTLRELVQTEQVLNEEAHAAELEADAAARSASRKAALAVNAKKDAADLSRFAGIHMQGSPTPYYLYL